MSEGVGHMNEGSLNMYIITFPLKDAFSDFCRKHSLRNESEYKDS